MRYFECETKVPFLCDICGQLNSPDGFLHHRRNFDYHVLIIVQEGTLCIEANGVPFRVSKGQYLLLMANEEHFGLEPSLGKLSYFWVHFKSELQCCTESELLQKDKNRDMEQNHLIIPEEGEVRDEIKIRTMTKLLLDLSVDEESQNVAMRDYAITLLCLELSRESLNCEKEKMKKMPETVLAVSEWIKTHYYQEFTIRDLAKKYGYQADYLSVLFKKNMGISLSQYTNRIRIMASKSILQNYDLSIQETAYSCGFTDEKYFMRIFKRLEGMTPSQFRQSGNTGYRLRQ